MKLRRLVTLQFALLSSCSVPEVADLHVGEVGQPIVGGQPDDEHPAVVAFGTAKRACSAVIVEWRDTLGFALTAGHCVVADGLPQFLLQGADVGASSTIAYPVIGGALHPQFSDAVNDLAVVTFGGAGESTPTLPLLDDTSDTLAPGDEVLLVGYGETESGPTTVKHSGTALVSTVSQQDITTLPAPAGICHGDSGGAVIVDRAGAPHLAGTLVASDSENCDGLTFSARLSQYRDWIDDAITRTDEPLTCEQCLASQSSGELACVEARRRCEESDDCVAVDRCVRGCFASFCPGECIASPGRELYLDWLGCACSRCPQCDSDIVCLASRTPPAGDDEDSGGEMGGAGAGGVSHSGGSGNETSGVAGSLGSHDGPGRAVSASGSEGDSGGERDAEPGHALSESPACMIGYRRVSTTRYLPVVLSILGVGACVRRKRRFRVARFP